MRIRTEMNVTETTRTIAHSLLQRAPLTLRVHRERLDRTEALAELDEAGIASLQASALNYQDNMRRFRADLRPVDE